MYSLLPLTTDRSYVVTSCDKLQPASPTWESRSPENARPMLPCGVQDGLNQTDKTEGSEEKDWRNLKLGATGQRGRIGDF